MRLFTNKPATSIWSMPRSASRTEAQHRSDGRSSVGASAVQESREHDSQRHALANWASRRVRSARRDLHGAYRERATSATSRRVAGAHDRSPVWSPDGTQLAWLSDASGEYQLMIGDPTGVTPARAIRCPQLLSTIGATWSPDGTSPARRTITQPLGHRSRQR